MFVLNTVSLKQEYSAWKEVYIYSAWKRSLEVFVSADIYDFTYFGIFAFMNDQMHFFGGGHQTDGDFDQETKVYNIKLY
jgi:hypothetical protein